MAKRKSAKTRKPAVVHVRRYRSAPEWVRLPVKRNGDDFTKHHGVNFCYSEFSHFTGAELRPGEIAKVRIDVKKLKR